MNNLNIGSIVDAVAGVVLIFCLYRGLVKGFSGEIIGLVGFFAASYCAWNFSDPAVKLALQYIKGPDIDETVVALICGVIIFFTVEIIFAVIGWVLSYAVKVTQLTFMDHLVGMLIGALKTGFCIIIAYAVIISFKNVIPTDWMKDSYAMTGASYVWPYVRDFMQEWGLLDFTELTGVAQ